MEGGGRGWRVGVGDGGWGRDMEGGVGRVGVGDGGWGRGWRVGVGDGGWG